MSSAPLAGRVVLVSGSDSDLRRDLSQGLEELGATVMFGAGSEPVDIVVHVVGDAEALQLASLDQTDATAWERRCEAVLRDALACAQAAFVRMRDRGGRLIFVTPTLGLTGAAGLVPYATAVEGVRSLAKSAARQWGAHGITVNCVAPWVEGSPSMATPALGRAPDIKTGAASAVAFLAGELASSITGTTVVVDGGAVMAP